MPICNSEDVTVEDLACISGRLNSDGINTVSSSRVTVRRTFVRSHDDSFAVKTTNPQRPATDILYQDCVAWDDWGCAFGITYETRADIRDVVFRDCEVLFARNWPLAVHVVDAGTVGPVRFERINIRYPHADLDPMIGRQAIKLDVTKDVWAKDEGCGHIRGVTFRDVDIAGHNIPPILIPGRDPDHLVEDVLFENVRINGKPLTSPDEDLFDVNEHVSGLTVQAADNMV